METVSILFLIQVTSLTNTNQQLINIHDFLIHICWVAVIIASLNEITILIQLSYSRAVLKSILALKLEE